ncbi:MAG: matrixin family metalloprotease, partial [Planctomycetota bacterium]
HELAHLIGFGHSSDRSSVMYRELSVGKAQRQFTAHDLALMSVLNTPSSRSVDQVFARGGV